MHCRVTHVENAYTYLVFQLRNAKSGLVCKRYLMHPILRMYRVASISGSSSALNNFKPNSMGMCVGLQVSIPASTKILCAYASCLISIPCELCFTSMPRYYVSLLRSDISNCRDIGSFKSMIVSNEFHATKRSSTYMENITILLPFSFRYTELSLEHL